MSSRKVPARASAWNELSARIAAVAPQPTAKPAVRPRQAEPADQTPLWSQRLGVTWLSDMLTADRNSFGVVRMLLALAVLVSHSIYLTTAQGELEPLYRWTNYTLGQHGVQVFFFLSGILVAQSLFASRDIRDYATARALRVFPALIMCVLLTALVAGPLLTALPSAAYLKDQGVAAYIAKTISLWSGSAKLPGLFADNPVPGVVNTSVWTLKYEVLCYALLGLSGWCVIRMQRWRETAFALAALWLAVVLYKPTGLELHGGAKSTVDVLRYFTIFFGAGVMAFALRHHIPVHAALLVPLGALFWAAIGTRFQEPAAAVCLGYLALWIATFRFGILRDFTNQSDYSYATYLYHMPVAQVLLHFWPQIHVVPLILMTTGVVIWLAFLSWELVERPALALRHRIWTKTPESAEQAFEQAMASAEKAVLRPGARPVGTKDGVASTALPIVRDKQPSDAEVAAERAAARLAREMASARAKADAAMAAKVAAADLAEAKAIAAAAQVAREHALKMAVATPERVEQRPASAAAAPAVQAPERALEKSQSATAHVWRPMPSVKRLKIHSDDAAAVAEPIQDTQPEVTRPHPTVPLDLIKRAAASMPVMPTTSLDWSAFRLAPKAAPKPEAAPSVSEAPRPSVPASRIAFATKRPAAADVAPIEPALAPPFPEPSRAVVALPAEDDEDGSARQRVSQPRPAWTRPMGAPQPT